MTSESSTNTHLTPPAPARPPSPHHQPLTSRGDAKGAAESFVYDARDRRTSHTDRINAVTALTYDENSNLRTVTDVEGGVTAYTHDPRNLPTQTAYPGHSTGRQRYVIPVGQHHTGPMNYLTFVNDDDAAPHQGQATFSHVLVYESGQRANAAIVEIDSAALVADPNQDFPAQGTVSVGPNGRSITLAGNRWQSLPYTYNVTPDTILEFVFASPGLAEISAIGFDNNANANDSLDRLFKLRGSQVIALFDNNYNGLYVPETAPGTPDFDRVTLTHDALHRPRQKTDQLGDETTYAYDLAGRLTGKQFTAAPGSPNAADSGKPDTFTHDRASRLLTAASQRYGNTVTYTYTDDGLIASENIRGNVSSNPAGYTHSRGYDAADRLISITYPNGVLVERTYTARDQLATITRDADGPSGGGPATSVASFQYDDAMRETARALGNGLTRTTAYGRSDHLPTSMTVAEAGGANPRPGLSWSTYGYDANKNLSSATSGGVMNGYSFTTQQDAEDRLTAWNRTNNEPASWTLTDVGDWSAYSGDALSGGGVLTAFNETRQHNDVHEILEIDDGQITPIEHDAKGNLTLDDEGRTYTWNFENRLKEVRDSNGDLLVSCTYDALGRRTTKMVPGVAGGPSSTTAFVHLTDTSGGGMGQLLAEYEDNALKRQYTYGEYIDEPITLTRYDASLPGGEETLWYHRDRQYNVIGLTSGGGAVVERYAYGPYGERRVLAPDGTTVRQVSAYGNPLGHQGLYHDEETGLIKNGARYRDPRAGRFISRDPSGYVDGPHLYQLLTSRPLNFLDPTGHRVVAKFRYTPTAHLQGRRMSYNQYMNQMRSAGRVIRGGIVSGGISGAGDFRSAGSNKRFGNGRQMSAFAGSKADGLSSSSSVSSDKCKITVRCGGVDQVKGLFVHCEVIIGGSRFGLSGPTDNQTSGGASGTDPLPHEEPAGFIQSGQRDYSGTCGNSCSCVKKCAQEYIQKNRPSRYVGTGPNSNTYAHNILRSCGCSLDRYCERRRVVRGGKVVWREFCSKRPIGALEPVMHFL